MSSLLRTTAAAAALGVGFAGTAFAAPELPGIDGLGSLPAAPDLMSAVPAPDVASDVPSPFSFVSPHVDTAAPDVSSLDDFGNVSGPSTDPGSYTSQNTAGALAALDTAKSMAALAQQAAAQGDAAQGDAAQGDAAQGDAVQDEAAQDGAAQDGSDG